MFGWLVKFTLFLAPTGIFFLPISALGSFRTFYIPLLFVSVWGFANVSRRQLSEIGLLLLIVSVFWASAMYGYVSFDLVPRGFARNPFIRWAVITNLVFGFYFVGHWLQSLNGVDCLFRGLDVAYKGFVVVFVLGFALYIGVVFGPIPVSIYRHVVTVEQNAFGYLRFSPGTYPNEFGTLCSFFALYAFVKYARHGQIGSIVVALTALVGIALASTRSAYITLALGMCVLVIGLPSLKRQIQVLAAVMVAASLGLFALNLLSFNLLGVLQGGYTAATDPSQGSLGERFEAWRLAYDQFVQFPFFGFGFESPKVIFLHNLFLQELFGLGLIGCAAVIILSVFFWLLRKLGHQHSTSGADPYDMRYFFLVRIIALEHTVLFGLNNHNQSHFLTWLTFALFVVNVGKRNLPERLSAESSQAPR